MLMIGIARIGNEPIVKYTPDGRPVMDLSVVFDYGKRTENGRPSQWVRASMWGTRCEKLAPYIKKGDQVHLVLNEPHVETFERKDGTGTGFVLRATVTDLGLIGGNRQDRADEADPEPQKAPQAPPKAAPGRPFDGLDDDIPF